MRFGFNYHPSRQGCQYWEQWDPEAIRVDLSRMAMEGFDTIRFFLFWKDFEPQPGEFDSVVFDRLHQFVKMAAAAHIRVIPAILTIWMNGQLFDLPWRCGRDLWRDQTMVEHAAKFCEAVAGTLSDCENVEAYDIGDEMVYVGFDTVTDLSPSEADAWLQKMSEAICKGDPKARVMMGNDHFAVIGNHALDAKSQANHLDQIAVHGFPLWTPFQIESNQSVKASHYVPFLVELARLYGTPFVDEFGLYGASESCRADYVNAAGTSCVLHGANGLVAWCWQDFATKEKPYALRPGERFVGFHDLNGQKKPSADALLAVKGRSEEMVRFQKIAPRTAIFVAEQYGAGNVNHLEAKHTSGAALFYSYLLLQRLQIPTEFAKDRLERYQVLIIPSVMHLTEQDLDQIRPFVERGGTVFCSPGSYLYSIADGELFGVEHVDFTLDHARQERLSFEGAEYRIDWQAAGFLQVPVLSITSAEVLARYQGSNLPAFTCRRYGKGRAFYLNAPIELMLNQPFALENETVRNFYKSVLQVAGVVSPASFSEPDVETAVMHGMDQTVCWLINHAPDERRGVLTWEDGTTESVQLAGKAVLRVEKRR